MAASLQVFEPKTGDGNDKSLLSFSRCHCNSHITKKKNYMENHGQLKPVETWHLKKKNTTERESSLSTQ